MLWQDSHACICSIFSYQHISHHISIRIGYNAQLTDPAAVTQEVLNTYELESFHNPGSWLLQARKGFLKLYKMPELFV